MPDYALVVPGLDGYQDLLRGVAPDLLPGLKPLYFDHMQDDASGGVDGMADRAVGLLDELVGPDTPAVVIGESFGGTVALTIARRHPHRVRGLVLLSTFGWYPEPHRRGASTGLKLWDLVGDGLALSVLKVARVLGLASQLGLPVRIDLLRSYLTWQLPDLATYRRRIELVLEFDARPWLHQVQVPTLVVSSHSDPVVPVTAGRELVAGLPKADYFQLHVSHLPHITRAREVGTVITHWLASACSPLVGEAAPSRA